MGIGLFLPCRRQRTLYDSLLTSVCVVDGPDGMAQENICVASVIYFFRSGALKGLASSDRPCGVSCIKRLCSKKAMPELFPFCDTTDSKSCG